MSILLVFLGGAVGAPARYLTDRWVRARTGGGFPWGTLTVNVIGCFVLGVIAAGVTGRGWSAQVQALMGSGFCGGLTTFSTFSVETVELFQLRRASTAAIYVLLSCGLGIGAAACGYAVL